MTHLITLQQIRDKSLSQDGWEKLLSSLGNPTDLSMKVSFGDIAKSNSAQDALWCLRCIDDRRFAVSLVLPSVTRASKHTTDKRVHDCVALLHKFVAGQKVSKKDLKAAADAAYAVYAAYAADAAAFAAFAAAFVSADGERQQQIADIIALSPLFALTGGEA